MTTNDISEYINNKTGKNIRSHHNKTKKYYDDIYKERINKHKAHAKKVMLEFLSSDYFNNENCEEVKSLKNELVGDDIYINKSLYEQLEAKKANTINKSSNQTGVNVNVNDNKVRFNKRKRQRNKSSSSVNANSNININTLNVNVNNIFHYSANREVELSEKEKETFLFKELMTTFMERRVNEQIKENDIISFSKAPCIKSSNNNWEDKDQDKDITDFK